MIVCQNWKSFGFLVQAVTWYKPAQQFNVISKRENLYQPVFIFSEFPHSHLSISTAVCIRKRSLFSSQGIQGAFVCPLSLSRRTVLLLQKWHLCPVCFGAMTASWMFLEVPEIKWRPNCSSAKCCFLSGMVSAALPALRCVLRRAVAQGLVVKCQSAVDRAKEPHLQSQSSVLQDCTKGDPINFTDKRESQWES